MQGSGGSRGLFVHLLAGAALGAVVVLMAWILSGGRPFGEVVGTSDVSSPTTSVKQTDVQKRLAVPAAGGAQLESEPPDLGASSKGRGDSLEFRKEPAPRPSRAKTRAAAKRAAAERRARRRAAVRVLSPPAGADAGSEALPVAALPSPAPSSTPAPTAAPPVSKPAKPRAPTYVAGAGEG